MKRRTIYRAGGVAVAAALATTLGLGGCTGCTPADDDDPTEVSGGQVDDPSGEADDPSANTGTDDGTTTSTDTDNPSGTDSFDPQNNEPIDVYGPPAGEW